MAQRDSILKCPHCKFTASNSQGLARHLNHRHRPWKFACRRCGERFPLRQRLLQHEQLAHGLMPGDEVEHAPAAIRSRSALSSMSNAVPIPLDLMCRECGRQMQSGSGFRSHMSRSHPTKWTKMRRLYRARLRRFKQRGGRCGNGVGSSRTVGCNDKDDSGRDGDHGADDDDGDNGVQTPATLASISVSSETNSTSTSATATPKQSGGPVRVCPVCQRVCSATYYSRHFRLRHREAWEASGGGRRKSAPSAAIVKQEPLNAEAPVPHQPQREVSEATKSKLLVKITRLQSLPQVQSAQQQQASSPGNAAAVIGSEVSCGHCSKHLSCRTSLFRHIRSVHQVNHICMRCRRGFNSAKSARIHIISMHRMLRQSDIDILLRYAGCKPSAASSAPPAASTAAAAATFELSPPSTPIENDAEVDVPLCLRPAPLDDLMPPPPPPPPPPSSQLQFSRSSSSCLPRQPPTASASLRLTASASCDLDASSISEESDDVMKELHPCDRCQLSFISAEFLANHRPFCESFSFSEFRIVSASSLAEASAEATAGPQRTPCPFCMAAVVPARLQRHIRRSAAAEKARGSLLHTRPQVYMCGICYQAFPGAELLQNHQVRVHMDPANRSVLARRCPECRLWLIGDAALADHLDAMHGEPTPFGCQVCRTHCPNRVALVTHYRWVHLLDGGEGDGLSDDSL